jgi:thioredoxin reductase (NADPH)
MIDSLVIGAGPAGLTAAVYLARFRRSTIVTDSGCSRARYIPLSRNTPGFFAGVAGEELLAGLREQAARFGIEPRAGVVTALRRRKEGDGFDADFEGTVLSARTVVLATGIEDVLPPVARIEEAIRAGAVRLCAVCDGYEAEACNVAVYGAPENAFRHAKYMRTFARNVTVILEEGAAGTIDADEARRLSIAVVDDAAELAFDGECMTVRRRSGETLRFSAFYPVLGMRARSQLATDIGARCTDEGSLFVDPHQQTSIPGLYAAGDIVTDLNQISVAYGHAAIAATAIHNSLEHKPREECV